MARRYRVNEVARIAGISVRALHHYDEIGLLVPSGRTGAGYRSYDDGDLLRLQQILIGRTLGLSLEQIRRSLDDPGFDLRGALAQQRAELVRRIDETTAMIRTIDQTLAHLDDDKETSMDMKHIFDGFDPAAYEEEAKERWGHTDAYAESTRRAASYTEADWARMRDEQAELYADAFRLVQGGASPTAPEAMDVAEGLRLVIDRWFYPCSHAMHEKLADMYEADDRFAKNIDAHGPGLTAFLVAAIRANGRRHGG
jgi:DNA-binding transcriptional MerR regulator